LTRTLVSKIVEAEKGSFVKKIAVSLVITMSLTVGASCALSTDSLAQQFTDSFNSSLREMAESPIVQKSCVQEILDDKSNDELKKIEDRDYSALEDLSPRIAVLCWKMKTK
jgi:hypothetical protein